MASVGRQRFTPQPRHNRASRCSTPSAIYAATISSRPASTSAPSTTTDEALPLHFGGRYIFAAALPGALFGLPFPVDQRHSGGGARPAGGLRAGLRQPGRTRTAYSDLSLFVQDDWRVRPNFTLKLGLRYQNQFWPDVEYTRPRHRLRTRFPTDGNNIAPRVASRGIRRATGRRRSTALRALLRQPHHGAAAASPNLLNGSDQVRTLVAQLPTRCRSRPGTRRAAGCRRRRSGAYPEPRDPDRSRPGDAVRASRVGRRRPRAARTAGPVGQLRLRARLQAARHDRLQPDRAGARRRPPARGRQRRRRARRRRSCSTRRSARPGTAA